MKKNENLKPTPCLVDRRQHHAPGGGFRGEGGLADG